jgi:hypothetical protein
MTVYLVVISIIAVLTASRSDVTRQEFGSPQTGVGVV